MSKIVLITGATAGIGKACAEKFAKEGWHLILTGRRQGRLNDLEKQLQDDYGVKVLTLCFDVSVMGSDAPARLSFGFMMGICCGFAAKKVIMRCCTTYAVGLRG